MDQSRRAAIRAVFGISSESSTSRSMPGTELLKVTDRGLYCEAGDFHIDPWMPVDRALITHAHGDHARWGSRTYVCSAECERVLRTRIYNASITTRNWNET